MQPTPPPARVPGATAPSFYLTGRQPLRPGVLLLALLIALCAISAIAYGLGQTGRRRHVASEATSASRSPGASGGSSPAGSQDDDKDDDPSQIDTVVLGDAADAPTPARRGRPANTNVHATVIVRLPRFGPDAGLIPDTAAGHLLWAWLAAFNNAGSAALDSALPTAAQDSSTAAQFVLRQGTGGFNLLSAREVTPGVLVFRLRDQTPEGTEALGTLQMRSGSGPASIASFSLRSVPVVHPVAAVGSSKGGAGTGSEGSKAR